MSVIRLTVLFLVVASPTSTASATSEKSGRRSTTGRRSTSSQRGHRSVKERLGFGLKEPKPPIDLKELEGEWVKKSVNGKPVTFSFHVNEDGTFNYSFDRYLYEFWNISLSENQVIGEGSTRTTISFTNADGQFTVTDNIKVSLKDNPDFDKKSGLDVVVETWTLDPNDNDVIHLRTSGKVLKRVYNDKEVFHRFGPAQNTTASSAGPLKINKEEQKQRQQRARSTAINKRVFGRRGEAPTEPTGEHQ